MLLERSLHPDFVSNTYLLADEEAKLGCFVDAGGPVGPLVQAAERAGLEISHILLTHHHHDHVAELGTLRERWPGAEVLAHPLEGARVEGVTGDLAPTQTLRVGSMGIEAIHTPGHTDGMLSFLVDGRHVFTGDTLFKGSVGGVRAPGSTSYADLRASIMDKLLALPPATEIHPGHTDPTTVADELEANGFVRIWRGLDPEGDAPCTAMGRPATLVLLGDDYDGGHKAWVRWPDGADDIVPGSQVQTP